VNDKGRSELCGTRNTGIDDKHKMLKYTVWETSPWNSIQVYLFEHEIWGSHCCDYYNEIVLGSKQTLTIH